MRNALLLAAAGTIVLVASGTTFAQTAPASRGSPAFSSYAYPAPTYRGMTPEQIRIQGPPPPNTEVIEWARTLPPSFAGVLPQSLVGKGIYTERNDLAGTIVGVRDDRLYVSVGEYLGMSERVVEFPRDWLNYSGSGDNVAIRTQASKEQIRSLPAYSSAAGRAPAMTRAPGQTGY
jgi:hypothetical protein